MICSSQCEILQSLKPTGSAKRAATNKQSCWSRIASLSSASFLKGMLINASVCRHMPEEWEISFIYNSQAHREIASSLISTCMWSCTTLNGLTFWSLFFALQYVPSRELELSLKDLLHLHDSFEECSRCSHAHYGTLSQMNAAVCSRNTGSSFVHHFCIECIQHTGVDGLSKRLFKTLIVLLLCMRCDHLQEAVVVCHWHGCLAISGEPLHRSECCASSSVNSKASCTEHWRRQVQKSLNVAHEQLLCVSLAL